MEKFSKGLIVGLFTGAALGSVLGLLFAPEDGKTLRKKFTYRLSALLEELDEVQTKIVARKKAIGNNEAKLRGDKIVSEAQKRAEDLINEAENLIKAIETA